ncbi:MAG: transcriptional repressor LexA [Candidatus Woesebacteria bacterium]|nr:transcriptional repressor LexA [Candidatus Woesebacteria bacterium]
MNKKITPKQKETLDLIRDSINQEGQPPTINEIREKLGLKSLRSVTQRLEALENKGFIKRDRFKHRGISILNPLDKNAEIYGTKRIGVIASAGCDAMQVYAQQEYDEFIMVDKDLIDPRKEIVAIKALGNSMTDFGLNNGDYALTEVTENVQDGDRICAILGDMAVIKKLKIVSGAIILESEFKGSDYPKIILKEDSGKIFGKVIKIIPADKKRDEIEYIPIGKNHV